MEPDYKAVVDRMIARAVLGEVGASTATAVVVAAARIAVAAGRKTGTRREPVIGSQCYQAADWAAAAQGMASSTVVVAVAGLGLLQHHRPRVAPREAWCVCRLSVGRMSAAMRMHR